MFIKNGGISNLTHNFNLVSGPLILMHKAGSYLIRSNTLVTFFHHLVLSCSFLSRDTIFSVMMSSAFLAKLSTICYKYENIRSDCFITANPLETKTIASFYSTACAKLGNSVLHYYYQLLPFSWFKGHTVVYLQ